MKTPQPIILAKDATDEQIVEQMIAIAIESGTEHAILHLSEWYGFDSERYARIIALFIASPKGTHSPAAFTLESDLTDRVFPGYTNGKRWNGFAEPRFDKATVLEILKAQGMEDFGITRSGRVSYFCPATGDRDVADWEQITVDRKTTKGYFLPGWTWTECIDDAS